MSGQLASWVSQHCPGDKAVVDVVRELAINSHPDGTAAYAPTWEELAHRTRTSRSTVAAALKAARKLGVIVEDQPGRGRGRATVYRVQAVLCQSASSCWACSELASCLVEKVQPLDPMEARTPGRKGPVAGPKRERKGPAEVRKGPAQSTKGPAAGPTTENGERHPPSGGAVPHRESNDRGPLRVAGGSAARSSPDREKLDDPEPVAAAIPEESRRAIAALKRENLLRRHGIDPPAPAEASARAGSQVAGEAPASQPPAAAGGDVDQVVIPVEDPADVLYPSDDLGAVAGPCVVCQQACTSLHCVSGQVRHATCRDPVPKSAA